MGLMDGKKALICGVANEKSIAWAIANKLKDEGADLCFTYAGDAMKSRVEPLAEKIGASLCLPCDVADDDQIDGVFESIKNEWGHLDTLVHAIAFANRNDLKGDFLNTSRDGFKLAMDISAYSLVALSRGAAPLMEGRGGTVMCMSYLGSQQVIKNYNVMGVAKAALESSVRYLSADMGKTGVRVNAISAGPIKTLAAKGISKFEDILRLVEERSPMHKNVTIEDVAGTALYLASDLSNGVTGEIIYVDSGFNIIGV